ncbi:hypothetical protein [Nocardia sp. NBC_01329]|uniref:hypothetical protein n=1 Tax=Nocardia sp. NBC_01329 TaxID=2903594 RepID=UPI002E108C8C|nr:hypothetical protein OG405_16540 [Nocardia sp. NBC_01329]
MQSTEMSGVQRFVRRLLTDRGPGTGQVGGVALLGSPPSRPRRRSAPATDLLVWTPHGCTLVVLADFGSVQHGVLTTGPTGRWLVDDSAADLRTGKSTPNPVLRGRKLRNELAAIFRRQGLSEQIQVLVVLIPKTGSRISWTPRPPEDGIETILVRIGASAGLARYFERVAVGEVRWRGEDIARAFEMLGVSRLLPDPDELDNEGFLVAPGRSVDPRATGAELSEPQAAPRGARTATALSAPSVRPPGQRVGVPGPAAPASTRAPATETRTPGVPQPTREPVETSESEPIAVPARNLTRPARLGWFGARGTARKRGSFENGSTGRLDAAPVVAARERAEDVAARESTGPQADPAVDGGSPVRSGPSGRNHRESARPDRGSRPTAGVPARVRRGLAGAREIPARFRRVAATPQAAARPPREPLPYRPPTRRGTDLRYPAALGLAGVALAAVTATVFAASGFARFDVTEYGALCGDGAGNPAAAPYSAAGPSPVYLGGELPEYTAFGPSAVWRPIDPGVVQLVACVAQERRGELVRTCQYPPGPGQPVGRTLNLFTAVYRLTVYEARTGNRLAAMAITGDEFGADPAIPEPDPCRAATGAPEDGLPGRRHSRPSHRQIEQALTPFVTAAPQRIRAAR